MAGDLDPTILGYYDEAGEQDRLTGANRLELWRTQELLTRCLPAPPATIVDIGGGPGVYAAWLAGRGYELVLIDPVPLHVEQAKARGVREAQVGDARRVDRPDASADAVLLMGPLYHLVSREDRLQAWREAGRVVRPGGVVAAALISRFAALLDGTSRDFILDGVFRAQAERSAATGVLAADAGGGFTTAYFHHPDEIALEVDDAGLELDAVYGIEGPGEWMSGVDERLDDEARRDALLALARAVETEPHVLGASPHLLVVARRS
jgi:SAM-dependent methyltransferase